MIETLDTVPDGATLHADVIIVGAGPAGIAMAQSLRGHGLDIILLEAGGVEIEAALQDANRAEVAGLRHLGHVEGRARALGGAAKLWAGQCLPLDPIDFEAREWVPHSGWPINLADLQPFYRSAEAFFRVENDAYDGSVYLRFGLSAPRFDRTVLRSMFTVYTPDVDTGRAIAAEFRKARDLRVLLYAPVVQIETNAAANQVIGTRLRKRSGGEVTAQARAVALCGGGIENARLLLASNEIAPKGLGNDQDLVGRFFQEHPNGCTAVLEGGDPVQLQDHFRLFYRRGRRYFPKFALSESVQRQERVLNATAHLVFGYPPEPGTDALREIAQALRRGRLPEKPFRQATRLAGDLPRVGGAVARRFLQGRSPMGRPLSVRLQCHLEQAPDPESRITLSTERDALGMPRARVQWRLTELERRTAEVMTARASEEFARLGLGNLRPEPWLGEPEWSTHLNDCYHHSGTTRMAETPRAGVVDTNGAVFGVNGLYVCGSSVFPTCRNTRSRMMAARAFHHGRAAAPCAWVPLQRGRGGSCSRPACSAASARRSHAQRMRV
jgi:choline dehydrogenase-like flavoprotein